jgi:Enoyl-(Acyl carrier protein) reductase
MPGATATDMNANARDPVASRAVASTIALGRVGQPEDIAKVVAFLASDDGGWVTGQQIDAGGYKPLASRKARALRSLRADFPQKIWRSWFRSPWGAASCC